MKPILKTAKMSLPVPLATIIEDEIVQLEERLEVKRSVQNGLLVFWILCMNIFELKMFKKSFNI